MRGKTWCVAQSQATEPKLQQVLDYLCGQLDCKEIRPGGSCFNPNTIFRDMCLPLSDEKFKLIIHRNTCFYEPGKCPRDPRRTLPLDLKSSKECMNYAPPNPFKLNLAQYGKTWCVAQSQSTEPKLQQVLDYLCGQLDCKEIQTGGSCFNPNTV
uniref:X8 domain-containing protein n=1 Tax=Lactuca sativa TaxID=4236 RepID=A0A9R1XGE9_LACSA|nr:hypothetical protein LSAT_V11C500260530 [Lactuca sativa]